MLIVNDPLSGSVNLDAVAYFKVEGSKLVFVRSNGFIELDCGDDIAAVIAYKRIVSAYVAGEKILYLNELESDWLEQKKHTLCRIHHELRRDFFET